jgi:purine-nucleoside phosphorylase
MLADRIEIEAEVAYEEIPNFPVSTVESHVGRLIFGTLGGKKVVAMQGRFHAYEGYDQGTISFPIRVFKKLGAEMLLISNAAGAVNLNFKKGELMLIEDHINLLGGSPLTGEKENRFVDLSRPYDTGLSSALKRIAVVQKIVLHEGVYACVHGPHLETRAEYRFIKMIGADAVGMSTVPEVIVANQLGLPCVAVSVLTDTCDPDHLEPINIVDIMAASEQAQPSLCKLFEKLIERG